MSMNISNIRLSNSFSMPSSLDDLDIRCGDDISLDINNGQNNLKGLIVGGGQTVTGIYIAAQLGNVTYFLTSMPTPFTAEGNRNNISLGFLPVKVNSSNRISDISDTNSFGDLYNVPGTMSQSFGIRNSGTSTNPVFNFGYADNQYLSNQRTFSLVGQIRNVPGQNMHPVPLGLSMFTSGTPKHLVNFIMNDDFNLSSGQLYGGVSYKMTFTGETFFIPFYPPVTSTVSNGLATKIDMSKLVYPTQFQSSLGINVYLINSTLYQARNCSIPMNSDPRDILNQNMRQSLPFTVFTNPSDCMIGVNYDYCKSDVTCSGNCYSYCPTGVCIYNSTTSKFSCGIRPVPIIPGLADIVPVSQGLIFWIILIIIVLVIIVIIGAIYYGINRSSESNNDSLKLKSSEVETETVEHI